MIVAHILVPCLSFQSQRSGPLVALDSYWVLALRYYSGATLHSPCGTMLWGKATALPVFGTCVCHFSSHRLQHGVLQCTYGVLRALSPLYAFPGLTWLMQYMA